MNILKKLLFLVFLAPTGIMLGMDEEAIILANQKAQLTNHYKKIFTQRTLFNKDTQEMEVKDYSLPAWLKKHYSISIRQIRFNSYFPELMLSDVFHPFIHYIIIKNKQDNKIENHISIDYRPHENEIIELTEKKCSQKFRQQIIDLQKIAKTFQSEKSQLEKEKNSQNLAIKNLLEDTTKLRSDAEKSVQTISTLQNENTMIKKILNDTRTENMKLIGEKAKCDEKTKKLEKEALQDGQLQSKFNFMKHYTLPLVGIGAFLLGGLVTKLYSHYYHG